MASDLMLKKKVVVVKDDATGKERSFTLIPAGYKDGIYDCEQVCPLFKICHLLPDPRNSADKNSTLCEWCGQLADDDKNNYYPEPGSVDDAFADEGESVIKILTQKNPTMLKLKDFTDSFCPDFCEQYTTDYSKCDGSNAACIICKLLKSKGVKVTGNGENNKGMRVLDPEEFNTTETAALDSDGLM